MSGPGIDSAQILRQQGGRVDYSATTGLIAYDALGEDGYHDIHIMTPEGQWRACLTCQSEGHLPQRRRLPERHHGNPAWHPSGRYIVFQGEKAKHKGRSSQAVPGFGVFNDLWLMTSDGRKFYPLTDLPADSNYGVLHPHFSSDGRKLSWSELYKKGKLFKSTQQFGSWKLKVADFSMGSDGPRLRNIREYEPWGMGFYENHGFSPDGQSLLFTSAAGLGKSPLTANQICLLDLATGTTRRLTSEGYNEHAQFTPDGRHIVWMTNMGNAKGGTDYWMMRADGSDKVRLTDFNNRETLRYFGLRRLVVADLTLRSTKHGNQVIAYVLTNLRKQLGMIVAMDLKPRK